MTDRVRDKLVWLTGYIEGLMCCASEDGIVVGLQDVQNELNALLEEHKDENA